MRHPRIPVGAAILVLPVASADQFTLCDRYRCRHRVAKIVTWVLERKRSASVRRQVSLCETCYKKFLKVRIFSESLETRGRATAARVAHNHEVAGSTPAPGISPVCEHGDLQ